MAKTVALKQVRLVAWKSPHVVGVQKAAAEHCRPKRSAGVRREGERGVESVHVAWDQRALAGSTRIPTDAAPVNTKKQGGSAICVLEQEFVLPFPVFCKQR